MPTTSAATTEATHKSYILCACRLMPSLGHPKLPNAFPTPSMEQPESSISSVAPPRPSPAIRTAARGRAAELFAPTCFCLLSSAAAGDGHPPETGHWAARRHRRSHITRPGPTVPLRGSDLRRLADARQRRRPRPKTGATPIQKDDTVPSVEDTAVPAATAAYLDAATAAPLHPV